MSDVSIARIVVGAMLLCWLAGALALGGALRAFWRHGEWLAMMAGSLVLAAMALVGAVGVWALLR